ncbi:MAG: hypothetical protein A3G33_11600 [Omnitrophica bacterium RIFCSPLOWO2_12_FULL_44_17]|uniref:Aminomethyltransferase n=1 Tax=Candidatus Danuiimicrobium aquiferis TaxID=1801832 RepID=A0A1G1KRT2_9BACT|nr:MAG: hypothetical protein A3B72_09440 [Omnitrophica bacterium RIFCSPHIGHO2_02_FULL_45_28]OGW91232.1 MAG: hypothetical protein A3E74_02975 [Omnitrophica bacterium RIFCSPHIGHO2_12_FULL_44_12]OGW95633.1 MAG: hypothetical protein A3G33_11600 [Omnitrophica bacterium RIFCSPLOWO2_12_FULL_44_17]OGX03654.1 MAG: hypothetical protein A3J12_00895 [Omnitrophica bacterium RIFCSPLOWO2_02_FULL_44_11]
MSDTIVHDEVTNLKKLPLHKEHERLGARIGAFGSWLVPIQYTSIIEEHQAVRHSVGIFDISHMGEFFVSGANARRLVNQWITNDIEKLWPGRILYSPVCRENGGTVDDVLVYEMAVDRYLIVVNASNVEKDFAWFGSHRSLDVVLQDKSPETGMLSVQGPLSKDLVEKVFSRNLAGLAYYHFQAFQTDLGEIILSETGYTGEKGYEIFCPIHQVVTLWQRFFEHGAPMGLKPIGFGARDTLRLEAKMCLYGHELTDDITPLEAGLSWAIGWGKEDFIGFEALKRQREAGLKHKLVGFEIVGRGIAREGCVLKVNEDAVGRVTSGTYSPTLKKNIGLGLIAVPYSQVGQNIDVEVRGNLHPAKIIQTPFYKRQK